jgi:hypothetical protein
MQDKQKVTLYLSPELHHKLKIRSAVDSEPMSAITERAIVFYLSHPEVIEEVEASEGSHGSTYKVYICPECEGSMVLKAGDMVSLREKQPGVLGEEELIVQSVNSEELIPARV